MSTAVSIIMAVKNEASHIKEAVDSILIQSISDFELIIVDDGSSDGTKQIISDIVSQDSRVFFFENPGAGKVSAFKYGYSHSNGAFIALFAGDDVMPADSLQARVSEVTEMVSPRVLLSKIQVISIDKNIHGLTIPKKKGVGNASGASIFFDRAAGQYLMDIPSELPNEDTWMELCLRFIPSLNVRSHDKVSCLYRVHLGNSISIKEDFEAFNLKFSSRMKAINKFIEKYRDIVGDKSLLYLEKLSEVERNRIKGNWIPILFSSISLAEKLRFISYSTPFFYNLRKRFREI